MDIDVSSEHFKPSLGIHKKTNLEPIEIPYIFLVKKEKKNLIHLNRKTITKRNANCHWNGNYLFFQFILNIINSLFLYINRAKFKVFNIRALNIYN